MACDVVAHIEVRIPKLAKMMWGDRRGCFEVPKKNEKPKVSPSMLPSRINRLITTQLD